MILFLFRITALENPSISISSGGRGKSSLTINPSCLHFIELAGMLHGKNLPAFN